MHDLDPIATNTRALMRELGRAHLGRPLQDLGWTFCFDRARRRLGRCLWKKGDRPVKMISLSRSLAAREGWALMEDVARHEIAHALDYETRGRSAHDWTWKTWARRCGADPTRCYEGELADDPTSPYAGRCPAPGCGHVRPFYRAVTASYFCPRCEEAADRPRSYLRVTDRRSGQVLHEGGPEPTRPTASKRPPKYLGRCPRCEATRPFARRPKRRYACAACCHRHARGRFDPRFELKIGPALSDGSFHREATD